MNIFGADTKKLGMKPTISLNNQSADFISNIDTVGNDLKKTWKLINELTSRKHKRLDNISKINIDNKKAVTEASEISDTFHHHFANIGENLEKNFGKSSVNPIQYLKSPNSVFSFNEIVIGKVRHLLNQILLRH